MLHATHSLLSVLALSASVSSLLDIVILFDLTASFTAIFYSRIRCLILCFSFVSFAYYPCFTSNFIKSSSSSFPTLPFLSLTFIRLADSFHSTSFCFALICIFLFLSSLLSGTRSIHPFYSVFHLSYKLSFSIAQLFFAGFRYSYLLYSVPILSIAFSILTLIISASLFGQ